VQCGVAVGECGTRQPTVCALSGTRPSGSVPLLVPSHSRVHLPAAVPLLCPPTCFWTFVSPVPPSELQLWSSERAGGRSPITVARNQSCWRSPPLGGASAWARCHSTGGEGEAEAEQHRFSVSCCECRRDCPARRLQIGHDRLTSSCYMLCTPYRALSAGLVACPPGWLSGADSPITCCARRGLDNLARRKSSNRCHRPLQSSSQQPRPELDSLSQGRAPTCKSPPLARALLWSSTSLSPCFID
jgi:hypothetical protein